MTRNDSGGSELSRHMEATTAGTLIPETCAGASRICWEPSFRCHWSRDMNPALMSGRHAATAAEAATHQSGRRHQPIVRLLVSQVLEQQQVWQLKRRRFFSETSLDKIPEPEGPLELTCGSRPPSRQKAPAEAHKIVLRSTQNTSIG